MLFQTIVPVFLFLLGVLFLLIGSSFFWNMFWFKRMGIATIAIVTDIKNSNDQNRSGKECPVISYTTENGSNFTYDVGSQYSTPYSIGQKLKIVYSKIDPRRVIIDSFFYTWCAPLVLSVLGAAGMCFGVLQYLKNHIRY